MLQIWGRRNSVNVQKLLWCCAELNLEYERFDAGMEFGRTAEPRYLEMNPNGRVPTLVDNHFVLWESNSILRYLAMQYGADSTIYPAAARERALVDRWLDWSLSTLQPAERPVFWASVRTPPNERNYAKLETDVLAVGKLWHMLDEHLANRTYVETSDFTLADIVLGAFARRWFGLEGIERPRLDHLSHWYDLISTRPGFVEHVAHPLS
jgi:glutathione S-transferase